MIPVSDSRTPRRRFPVLTYGLIAVNILVFFYELTLSEPRLDAFITAYGVVPIAVTAGRDIPPGAPSPVWLTLFTSQFLHGGWAHFLGNMLYLWIFGDNVEDRMGHLKYLVFYLLCGWTASYAHIWSSPGSSVPSIGASGAIAGVLGAYITLYPGARVVTILPLGIFVQLIQVPAVFFLGLWFLQQFLSGTLSLAARTAQTGGVAWWAHIGGFAAGFVLVWLFKKKVRQPLPRDVWWQEVQQHGRRRGL